MKTLAAVLAVVVLAVAFTLTYKHGVNTAYNQGWSDAHCGVGQNCESGDN